MSGTDLKQLSDSMNDSAENSRKELLEYVSTHRDQVLTQLQASGEAVITTRSGGRLTIRHDDRGRLRTA